MTRQFTDSVAVRERVPLLIGIVGPSGGGKTMSALRLAAGVQRVAQGETFGLDSESRRMLHYAEKFKFHHVPFAAPFSPLDYQAGIEHCVQRGASVVIVDSMSHEHEGPGGVLEWHDREMERMAGNDPKKAERVKMLAWSAPKQARQRLINTVLQLPLSAVIFCFRAKEKIKPRTGQEPLELGWMPIAGEQFIYEMTINALLPPVANGVPQWNPTEPGAARMVKLPEQFRELFKKPTALCEEHGEAMARWAAGGARIVPATAPAGEQAAESAFAKAMAAIETAAPEALGGLQVKIIAAHKAGRVTDGELQLLRVAFEARMDG